MKKVYLTVTVDPALKAEVAALAKEMDLPVSMIVTAFMREFILTRTVYFTGLAGRRSTLRALREYGYRIGELRYEDALEHLRAPPLMEQAAATEITNPVGS